jgi:signal transduction histidine kinase
VIRPTPAMSVAIFFASVAGMAWLRLYVYGDQVVTLTYAVPMLICLVYPDRRLLWALAGAFVAMAVFKIFWLLPLTAPEFDNNRAHFVFQVTNILVAGLAIHQALGLQESLAASNASLHAANADLLAREEEIARQNEELQQQNEELQQQAEELQQQTEEIHQQTEELHAQAEELGAVNAELREREDMLRVIMESLPLRGGEDEVLDGICRSLMSLLSGDADAVAVLVRSGDELVVRASSGIDLAGERVPYASSLASVVLEHDRTAYVDDLALRPDIAVPGGGRVRSILAAPLTSTDGLIGAVELYATGPRHWTEEHFRIVGWVARQCALMLEVRGLHAALATSNANLETLVAARTAELGRLVDELEHFSYTITHDMRAPLRAMHGFSRMLLNQKDTLTPVERDEFLERIATAAARMDRLITDALVYAKSGREEMKLEPVDAGALVAGMIASYPELQGHAGSITVDGPLPSVVANEAGLTQCFSNLLSNAVKFVEPGRPARIRIRAERSGPAVRIWVEDNGIGVPEEMKPRIFHMFQRASRSYDGTGIGLALVRKVTERMGGRVGLESNPGEGSRFWLEFAAAEPVAQETVS